VRHFFSIPFEGKPRLYLGTDSEMIGHGRNVSATANMDEITDNVLHLAVTMSLMARQMPVWMSSCGVISDGYVERQERRRDDGSRYTWFEPVFDGGEHLREQRGFQCAKIARAILPKDLMTFETLVHGGESQMGKRVRAVPAKDETRADQALHTDGRVCSIEYAGRWREVRSEKSLTITSEYQFGDLGRVVQGRR
jgi:hypothetical protein